MSAHFRTDVHLRWADIDANFHLRHSVYYDLCAQQRMAALSSIGLSMDVMQQLAIGPILFREECIFHKEIKLTDTIHIDLALRGLSKDLRKFAFEHRLIKADGTLCATAIAEGAWMDTRARRITPPPELVKAALDKLPRTADLTW